MLRIIKRKISIKRYFLMFVLLIIFWAPPTTLALETYDGLWFLGFNLKKDLLSGENGLLVRRAVSYAIQRKEIVADIVAERIVPDTIIPYGMEGYQSVEAPTCNIKLAKALMSKAGLKMTDKRLKNIRLLHTNGILTKQIANKLKQDLQHIGIKLILTGIDFADQDKWIAGLKSGAYDLHLMGFKAE
ncbi:ABC transporter substrate-binding protein [Candidatus Margulisiibacteriota bacterium]